MHNIYNLFLISIQNNPLHLLPPKKTIGEIGSQANEHIKGFHI